MREFVGKMFGGSAPRTPLDEAQALIYQAVELPDPAERIKLARKALELSADCADAYVLLAENSPSRHTARRHFEQGVAAGERALGPRIFQEEAGHFWGLLETRPYMRAREGLSHALWALGRREEAVDHLREMLRLNPHDNQGLRYALTSWLLNLDRDEELDRLLDKYDEPSANWAFTKALLAFRRQGDTPASQELLKAAHQRNKFVLGWLLGEEPYPDERPSAYAPGSPEEAYFYIESALSAWKSIPGAISWVRRVLVESGRRPSTSTPKFDPPAAERARLQRLPSVYDVWQVGFRQIPKWLESEGQRVIPWVLLAGSRTSGLVMATTIVVEEPSAADLWGLLTRAMERPPAEEPHRPVQIEVRTDARWETLRPHLEGIGIDVQENEELDLVEEQLEDLAQHLLKDEPPGMLDMPRVRPEQVGRLFQAAAEYYRRAPWRAVGDEQAILVECSRFQSGPWYAVIMGRSGVTLGLALYEDLEVLKRLWAGRLNEPESARRTTALALTFDPESQVVPKDLDAARRHGWEVVDPEAIPAIYRKEPGMIMRPPLSWELVLVEGCLRAIPAFLARHPPGESGRHAMTVPAGSGELDLILSWVDEESMEDP